MKVSSTYSVYIRNLLGDIPLEESVRLKLDKLIAEAAEYPVWEQSKPLAGILNILGGMEGYREFGFILGAQIPLTSYGGASMAIRLAPTYRDALRFVAEYHATEIPLLSYGYEDTADGGAFSVGFRASLDANAEAMVMAAVTSSINTEISRATHHHVNFTAIQLTSSSRGLENLYQKHFSVRPVVGHDANRLLFDEWALALPNPLGDAETFETLCNEYEERALSNASAQGMSDWVKDKVMVQIADPPSLKALADSIHITERQLRFALAKEGANYRDIVKECRLEVAASLFRNRSLQMSEIAYRLGYSELATFTNSFKRWTGQTPTDYRRALLKELAQSATD